jgi:hypothetical protein
MSQVSIQEFDEYHDDQYDSEASDVVAQEDGLTRKKPRTSAISVPSASSTKFTAIKRITATSRSVLSMAPKMPGRKLGYHAASQPQGIPAFKPMTLSRPVARHPLRPIDPNAANHLIAVPFKVISSNSLVATGGLFCFLSS